MRLPIVMVICAALALPATAVAEGKGHGNRKGGDRGSYGGNIVADAITIAERTIISNYILQHRGEPVFLAKPLPPGIQKNLARGKPLPPGIAKRSFPGDLLAQLPPRPGYDWLVVGTEVLLVAAATQLIVGVLTGAI